MKESDKNLLFLAVFGVPTLMFLGAIINGWVMTKLWLWFVVPTFGAQPLHIVPAIGLAMLVNYLTKNWAAKDDRGLWESIGSTYLAPLFILGYGWIIHLFMP